MEIGDFNYLTVLRDTGSGLFLGNEENEEVLLPGKFIPEGTEVGDELKVFIYHDHEARLTATTQVPALILGGFAYLEIVDESSFGAFADWGLDKDLLIPLKEQHQKLQVGEFYVVHLFQDVRTGRLVGSTRLHSFVEDEAEGLEEGQEVDLLIWETSDLGWNVIVNQKYKGLVYQNEIFRELESGARMKGYVKKLREDKKLDISLQALGYAQVEESSQVILQVLKAEEGFLPLHDKSSPEAIKEYFGMSKKTFKKAIGSLYKERLIRIEKDGIHLLA